MIKFLKIKNIQKDFIIQPGALYNINVENAKLYYSLLNDLLNGINETFIYSEDYKLMDFSKKTLIINNLFDIDPNGKKILTNLYKRISEKIFTKEDKQIVDEINSKIMYLLNKISFDLNLPVDYETDLDITKILNLYKFCFKNEYNSPLEKIVAFIKANLEINNYSLIITVNTLPIFSKEEIDLLSMELSYLNLSLINITLIQKSYSNIVESITIDDDLCEF